MPRPFELKVKAFADREGVTLNTVDNWIRKGAVQLSTTPGYVIVQDRIRPADRHGYAWSWFSGVYFIRCEGFIKIGYAQDVRARLLGLRPMNPFPLEPLAFIECPSFEVAKKIEAELHQQFAALRQRNEWFRDDSAIREYINLSCQVWPAPRRRQA